MVAEGLIHGDGSLYRLNTWVIMPNHVHAIWLPLRPMSEIMRVLKGRTGRLANRLLGRTGSPFWQDESFDHWIRYEELDHLTDYVLDNPVKARLVKSRNDWPWSSISYPPR
jgi:REP element-mobilizing transposase RayT